MEKGTTHVLKSQSRALCPYPYGESDCWLAGTTALKEQNQISLLQLTTSASSLNSIATFPHESEILSIAASKVQPDRIATSWNNLGTHGCTAWQINVESEQIQLLCQVKSTLKKIRHTTWHPTQKTELLVQSDQGFELIDVQSSQIKAASPKLDSNNGEVHTAAFQRGSDDVIAMSEGGDLVLFDTRSGHQEQRYASLHTGVLRALDFAPGTPWVVATGGDDCAVRVWDLRAGDGRADPLKEDTTHRHWVWQVAFHGKHSQLLLSSGGDGKVILHSLLPIFPITPHTPTPGTPTMGREQGPLVSDEHDDSVYQACWGWVGDWSFASMSYDGNCVVHQVPSSLKYQVVL